jgi:hypothetical protein
LVPIVDKSKVRPLGMDRGQVRIADDFDSLPDDLVKAFYGGELPPLAPPKRKQK